MNHVLEWTATALYHPSLGRHHQPAVPANVEEKEEMEEMEEMEDMEEENGSSLPLFFWGMLTALTLWWLYLRPRSTERRARVVPGSRPRIALHPSTTPRAEVDPEENGPEAEQVESAEDDLTVVYGIGPARAARLREAGLFTFAALAEADQTQLREILAGVGLGGADPSHWPQQARLAARGDSFGNLGMSSFSKTL